MTSVQIFDIPGLATVEIDTRNPAEPIVEIKLDPNCTGDIVDDAKRTPGPDDLYLRCDRTTARNHPELLKFMEYMTHYDHTGDGVPDCDHIIDAIEDALPDTDDKPLMFERPKGGWYVAAVMSIMPSAPQRHIINSFGELKKRGRLVHYLAGIPMLLAMIVLINLQIHFVPVMKYSVVSAFMEVLERFGLPEWLSVAILIVAINILIRRARRKPAERSSSPHTYGFFNRAALSEEQAFREGAEDWTLWQRIRSCLAFGAIHMVNLIYPLATILPLAVAGGFFMWMYLRAYRKTNFRRAALLEAAVYHRIYNRIALIVVSVYLIAWFGLSSIGMFVAFAVLMIANVMWFHVARRKQDTADSVELQLADK